MITLCEECFPQWEHAEVFASPAYGPCAQCGSENKKRHLFPRDPRVQIRDARLNEMVGSAEVIVTFRVDDTGTLKMETLARDEPPEATSAAIGFVEYLHANWKQLVGEAMALKTSAVAASQAGRTDIGEAQIILPNGRPAGEERDPLILGANGSVISSDPTSVHIELPASVAEREEEA